MVFKVSITKYGGIRQFNIPILPHIAKIPTTTDGALSGSDIRGV